MTLSEQAARRVELARTIGAEPRHWIATADALQRLVAEGDASAWGGEGQLFHGLPLAIGQQRSGSGLDLILAPRAWASPAPPGWKLGQTGMRGAGTDEPQRPDAAE